MNENEQDAGPQLLVVDPNDPKIRVAAFQVTKALNETLGFAGTVAVALLMVEAGRYAVSSSCLRFARIANQG